MLKSQRITIQLSEIRQKINAMPDDASAEDLNALTAEYNRLEAAYRAAIIGEQEETPAAPPEDGQPAEIRRLLGRASLGVYLTGAAAQRDLDGAEKELREAIFGDDARADLFPIDLLLPQDAPATEERADAATNVTTATLETQATIIQRVFAGSAAAYLGVAMPTVAAGQANYPVLTAGTTADVREPGVAQDAAAATLAVQSVNPVRATARYLFGIESTVMVRGFEEALAQDIRAVLSDKLDHLTINGQAAVNNVSPAFQGILSALTDPTAETDESTWETYLAAYTDRVDGRFSMDSSNVRLLVNPNTFQHAWDLEVGTDGRSGLLRDKLPMGRFRASANMPATASGVADAIAFATGNGMGYVAPVWRGVSAIRDPYTAASEGQVALTLQMLVGGLMVRNDMYTQLSFKTA